MRPASPRSPCTAQSCTPWPPRTRPPSCACWPSVATTWPASVPASSTASMACYATLIPGGAPTDLTAAKAAALLRRVRPATATAACRRQLARELLGDLRRIDTRLADNKAQLQDALAATGSTLTQIHGLAWWWPPSCWPCRRHRPVPQPGPLRQLHRYRPPGRLQRQPATPPAESRRQPPAECRPPHRRGLPGPRSRTRPPLLPAQAQRGQDPRRGPSSAEAAPGQRHLPAHPGRPTPTPTSRRLIGARTLLRRFRRCRPCLSGGRWLLESR
jgi:hypothetical protein